MGERRGGHGLVVHPLVVAGDHAGGDQALVRGHVREQDLADHVADGIHVLDVRAQLVVDGDVAAPVGLDAGLFEVQVDRVRPPRHADQHVVGLDHLLVLAVLVGDA